MAAEARDNRDIRKGQWQRWQQTGVSEEMWDNRGGGDGETGRRKRGRGAMRSYALKCPPEPRGVQFRIDNETEQIFLNYRSPQLSVQNAPNG